MLEVKHISKKVGVFQLGPVNLNIAGGKHVVLLGPSGAGKSLLLELLCGFLQPDNGQIFLNNKEISRLPPNKRSVGIVLQHSALFPHMSVADNIAYPLKYAGWSVRQIKAEVVALAEKCFVSHLLDREPASLSGGEIQRVSIARTLARKPELLLLDEPMTSLDVQLRDDLRNLIRQLKSENLIVLHLTHDPEEAIRLADELGIMDAGKIIQFGDPALVFRNPSNAFVAKMAGLKNYYKAIIQPSSNGLQTAFVNNVALRFNGNCSRNAATLLIDESQISLSLSLTDSSAQNCLAGQVVDFHKLPLGVEVSLNVGIILVSRITEESFQRLEIKVGKTVWASFKASAVRLMD